MRSLFCALVAGLSACGSLTPPSMDGGSGGGGGISFAGGGTGTTPQGGGAGGGGGGVTGGGGGAATGGGTGGGGTGGGGGATGGGGGAATGGGGGAVGPLTWASMSISGATSTSYVIGLSGAAGDLWAAQDTGHLFRSTGAAFSLQFSIPYGVKALYASGGTVVIVQTRSIRTCTTDCTQLANYADLALLNSPLNYNLFGEAVCGRGPNDITVVVSDTQNMAQLFHWDGTAWTRTSTSVGVAYPRSCWFDEAGVLRVVGRDDVAVNDNGASTVESLTTSLSHYYGGASLEGAHWVVGGSGAVWRKAAGGAWAKLPVSTSNTLWVVGALSPNEVYALGFYDSSVGNGFKWNGTTLAPMGAMTLPSTGSGSLIRSMLVTGPNELYVAGNNNSGPIILRGRR